MYKVFLVFSNIHVSVFYSNSVSPVYYVCKVSIKLVSVLVPSLTEDPILGCGRALFLTN